MIQDVLPSPLQHLLACAVALLVYVLTTRVRGERRPPASAIAWVLALSLVPYVVLPLYLLFGERKLRPHYHKPVVPPRGDLHWAAELIESFGLAPPAPAQVRLHADGAAARDALWETIDSARERLDVSTFIVGHDSLGREAIARLTRRAREGVKVRLLLDGYGALLVPRRAFAALREAGGEVAVFRPFLSLRPGPRNLRNHRKLTIADDRLLWSGGRNLAAEYFLGEREPPWFDFSFDLVGPVAAAAAEQFEADWALARGEFPRERRTIVAVPVEGAPAQFLPSGPDQTEDTVKSLLIDACFRARSELRAVTPYFVPDESLSSALRLAARRGVRVTIVLPRRSNHRLADFARARAMRELAAAGVQFQLLPAMAHAKAMVVDDTLAMCGSVNLDLRSLMLNHEANVVFYGAREIAWLAEQVDALARQGTPFEARPPGLLRDIAEGLLLTVAFQL